MKTYPFKPFLQKKCTSILLLVILFILVNCSSGRIVQSNAITLRNSLPSVPGMALLAKPSPENWKIENDAFIRDLDAYLTSNVKWKKSVVKASTSFKIIGTSIGVAGGIVGLLISGNTNVAAIASLVAGLNTAVASSVVSDSKVQTSTDCSIYLSQVIMKMKIERPPSNDNEYIDYVKRKKEIIDKIIEMNCYGF